MGNHLREFRHSQWIYLMHVICLVAPGKDVPVHRADAATPASLDGWSTEELALIIDEGRRQVDRQQGDLEQIRGRAQWLFAVAAGALAVLGGGFVSADPPLGLALLWLAGMALLAYGVGGAAAILTVKADFSMIHTAVLSLQGKPIDHALASSYARMMPTGENTVATRLTVFRQAVVFCLVGGYVGLVAALVVG